MISKKYLDLSIAFFVLAVVLAITAGYLRLKSTRPVQKDAFVDIPTVVMAPASTDAPSATMTPTISSTAMVTPQTTGAKAVFTYPDSYHILNITGHRQTYSLGCEASAAVDWANYYGVSIIEYTFQVSLPHSDNPEYGFVGDVNSVWGQVPPYAYGVNAGPVADLLDQYGLPAKSVRGFSLDEVRQQISEGNPIIAWVIGRMEWSQPETYVDSQGRSVTVAAYEHVVILTGYDVKADTIRFMSNGVFYDVPTQTFLTSWGVLGNMAVIYDHEAAQ